MTVCLALLELDTEKPMASRAQRIASRAGDASFGQSNAENDERLVKSSANDLFEAGHDFVIRRLFGRLKEQRPPSQWPVVLRLRRRVLRVEKVIYAVVVHFVHRYQHHVLG
jgi:hypothetical protein